jgi:hypothetical protein
MFVLTTIAFCLPAYALANRVSPKNWLRRLLIFYLFWPIALVIEAGISYLSNSDIQYAVQNFDIKYHDINIDIMVGYSKNSIIATFAYFTIGFFSIEGLRWVLSQSKRD